jgi:hypothetical protein
MTNRWRRTFLKALDVYFVLKPVFEIWHNFNSFPLSRHEPWCLRHTQLVVDLARSLREVSDADLLHKGHLLCEFLYWTRQLETMPEGVVRRLLHPIEGSHFPDRFPKDKEGNLLVSEEGKLWFAVARPGDHLFFPFQCELCHFLNVQGRSPQVGSVLLGGVELLKCLRRVNFNAFWSRELSTVSHCLVKINRALKNAHELGMSNPPLPSLGPWNLEGEFGTGSAVIMVKHSMDTGVTEITVQFETVRKKKSDFFNLYQASVNNAITAVIGGKEGESNWSWGCPFTTGGMTGQIQECIIGWETRWSRITICS